MSLSAFPVSYKDPLYSSLARDTEAKLNLPTGILDAIRTRGERSNANQISSAGAETPYQFIPSTRQGMINNHGVDPWQDPRSATLAAGQLLAENHSRTGSWNDAVARYEGGNRPGPFARQYASRVGNFDGGQTMMPQQSQMGNSLYPVSATGADPLAPQPAVAPVPLPGPGMSTNIPAASPAASHKRGGILGALESVFMPDPGSQWAGALRDGLFNAKESQQNYVQGQAKRYLDMQQTMQKIQQEKVKGEYIPMGGSDLLHVLPDGTHEILKGPTPVDDKTELADLWAKRRAANPNDPTLPLLESIINGNYTNTQAGEAAKNTASVDAARARAGATVAAARVRASATTTNKANALPHGFILDPSK